jgi:hypothetical protein
LCEKYSSFLAFGGRVGAFLLKSFCVGDWGQMLAGALYEAGLGASVQKASPWGAGFEMRIKSRKKNRQKAQKG